MYKKCCTCSRDRQAGGICEKNFEFKTCSQDEVFVLNQYLIFLYFNQFDK